MGILSIGLSGITTAQTQLGIAGNNIANVDTDGYTRQKVTTGVKGGNFLPDIGFVGNGSEILSIQRIQDDFIDSEIRKQESKLGLAESTYNIAKQVDATLSEETLRLDGSISDFFDSLQTANDTPEDKTMRGILLTKADELINKFKIIADSVDASKSSINDNITANISNANSLITKIATFNDEVSKQMSSGTGVSNAILDQREQASKELAQIVGITVSVGNDNFMKVTLQTGPSLIDKSLTATFATATSDDGSGNLDLSMTLNSNAAIQLTGNSVNGKLGGLFSANEQIIEPIKRQLEVLSLSFTGKINEQQLLGMDLDGNLGQRFFNDINASAVRLARSVNNSNNTGTAAYRVNIDTIANVTSDQYILNRTAGAFTLAKLPNGAAAAYTLGTTIDGFNIALDSGAVNNGDSFIIEPGTGSIKSMQVNLSQASEVALATPLVTQRASRNLGSGTIAIDQMTSVNGITAGNLNPDMYIEFNSSTTYSVYNAATNAVISGPTAYTSGSSISISNGTGAIAQVNISGAPIGSATLGQGDRFDLTYNTNGKGDSSNGLVIAGLQTDLILDGSSTNFENYFADIIGGIGIQTQQAKTQEDIGQIILNSLKEDRSAVSGVNIDEEVANMMKYQQIYQASARVMSISENMFDIIINTLG